MEPKCSRTDGNPISWIEDPRLKCVSPTRRGQRCAVEESDSPWSANIVMAKKKDGSMRY